MTDKIIMRTPASWHGDMGREGAPCGNGHVGALVYGGVEREIILLNHDRLWFAGWQSPMPDVSGTLPEIRRLLDEHRPDLANPILRQALAAGGYDAHNCGPLPLGDITIRRPAGHTHKHYRRTIDLRRAEVTVSWEENGIRHARRTFVSRADGLVYTEITASVPGSVSGEFGLAVHDRETMREELVKNPRFASFLREGDALVEYAAECFTTYAPARGCFGAVLRVIPTGGTIERAGDSSMRVTGADSVLLIAKPFVRAEKDPRFDDVLASLDLSLPYSDAMAAHEPLHRRLYDRASFTLTHDRPDTPNEDLLLDAFDDDMSPELAEKLWAFGRYLLVCATDDGPSADGESPMPASLVGLWGAAYQGIWAFHMFNVNFEMIYWNALSGNMPSLLRSALEYVEGFLDDYRENARKLFGCRGIYINSVNTPETGKLACLADHILNWTGAAAWLAQHFYDCGRASGDADWMKEHALPFMREAALFYEDFLFEGPDGLLVFAPSVSPENVSRTVSEELGSDAQCARNATMDIALCRELLTNLCEGSERFGMYAEAVPRWRKMLGKLPAYRVNGDGSLAEWIDPFYRDEVRHRHQSHLYPLFPGHAIREGDPLFDACRLAENRRRDEGLSSQSSWSLVYMACVYARLRRGNDAHAALSEMVRHCEMTNFLTVHNDWRRMGPAGCDDMRSAPLQIDAAVGFPAAVNEMLLDSSDGDLTLFPALPDRWQSGGAEGLLAMSGDTVSLNWYGGGASAKIEGNGVRKIRCRSGFVFENGENACEAALPCELYMTRTGGAGWEYRGGTLYFHEIPPFENSLDRPWDVRRNETVRAVFDEGIGLIPAHFLSGFPELCEIEFPSTLCEIGTRAFEDCPKLQKIDLPEGLVILGDSAFQNCDGTEEITLPSSVREIGELCFAATTAVLRRIDIRPGNPVWTSVDGVLYTADGGTLVRYPGGRRTRHFTVPDTVERIGEDAFCHAEYLWHVDLPANLRELGQGAFSFCSRLREMTVPDGIRVLPPYAFFCCERMEALRLPAEMEEIGYEACANMTALRELTIPTGITRIDYAVFSGCEAIREVSIPEGVTELGAHAFSCCPELRRVRLPSTLESIWEKAFQGCPKLRGVTLPAGIGYVSDDAFDRGAVRKQESSSSTDAKG